MQEHTLLKKEQYACHNLSPQASVPMAAATFAHGEQHQRATGNGPFMIWKSGQALIQAEDEGTPYATYRLTTFFNMLCMFVLPLKDNPTMCQ